VYHITHLKNAMRDDDERLQIKVFNYHQKLRDKSALRRMRKTYQNLILFVRLSRASVSEARMDVFQAMDDLMAASNNNML
jgi:hypothetical protein